MEQLVQLAREIFGLEGVLAILLVASLICAWFQHHRIKLLNEERRVMARKKKALAEELERAQSQPRPLRRSKNIGADKPRILIVEDEESVLELIESALNRRIESVDIETARDGAAALESVVSATPSLLILDLFMPGTSGFAVLKELDRRKLSFPVIVISGYIATRDEVARKASVASARFEFVSKPFSVEELVSMVKRLLRK